MGTLRWVSCQALDIHGTIRTLDRQLNNVIADQCNAIQRHPRLDSGGKYGKRSLDLQSVAMHCCCYSSIIHSFIDLI